MGGSNDYTIFNGYGFGGSGSGSSTGQGGQLAFTPGGLGFQQQALDYGGGNPLLQQLVQSGLFDTGPLSTNFLQSGFAKNATFKGIQNIQDQSALAAAQFYASDQLTKQLAPQAIQTQLDLLGQFAPKQLDLAAGIAQKDLELLSQLPQYKDFFQTQSLLSQTAQEGLQSLGGPGGSAGLVPGEVGQAFEDSVSNIAARFGLEGQAGAALAGGASLGAQKQLLGEQIRESRINQALGVNQAFRIPGSLAAGVGLPSLGLQPTGFGGAQQLLGGIQGQQLAQHQQNKADKSALAGGIGSLVAGGIGAFTGGLGFGLAGLLGGGGGFGGDPFSSVNLPFQTGY